MRKEEEKDSSIKFQDEIKVAAPPSLLPQIFGLCPLCASLSFPSRPNPGQGLTVEEARCFLRKPPQLPKTGLPFLARPIPGVGRKKAGNNSGNPAGGSLPTRGHPLPPFPAPVGIPARLARETQWECRGAWFPAPFARPT